MKIHSTLILPFLAAGALLLSACGKSEAPAAAASAAAPAPDGVKAVSITADDSMKFSVTEIRAVAGEKVRVTFKNVGRMPKQAMGHNWILLVPMADNEVLALAQAAAARAPEYQPADATKVLAHTKLLGPNESDTVEFTAPATPGDYPFVCTFPGHAALMKGKLIVAPKS
ncbi:azurin [Oleiharenicola lentus]|uniref:Azurin n=1 Tax=Oleiharenicola lentus TaxID=2508720 RepID=A0A4Q1C8K0_9BACT|nr:plastocyanin/azurin family copper-binding protein [Oleiharenicola lentus]RXK55180.1 azurin [Oleiharenicola lentus]